MVLLLDEFSIAREMNWNTLLNNAYIDNFLYFPQILFLVIQINVLILIYGIFIGDQRIAIEIRSELVINRILNVNRCFVWAEIISFKHI